MRYDPTYVSPRELAEIFPEAKGMVKNNIKIYEEEKQKIRDVMISFQRAVQDIAVKEGRDDFFIYFWAEAYIRYFHIPHLVALDKEIARLRRQLYYYENPPSAPHAVQTKSPMEDWEEKVRRAKDTPLTTFAAGYIEHPRRMGNRIVARCPFHTEKTPSFAIFIDSNTFHCFGCQANGDVIDFLMRLDNLSFGDAVRRLG